MTNAPRTRKTHVTRIFGTNKSGDLLDQIWADVERVDVSKSKTQTAEGVSQGLQRKYRWHDDPNSDDYTAEDADDRNTVVVKVCSPDEADVNDPEEWIPIRVKKSIRASGGDGIGQRYQERLRNNNDDRDNVARIVEPRRILHCDTNIDDGAQAAADAGAKAYVVPGDEYAKDLGTKDDSQYVEHEIIKFFKSRNANNRIGDVKSGSADVDSGLQIKLLNEYLIDESDNATGEIVGANGINPPYRLDPYQNIVNVKFATLYLVVSIGGGNQSFSFGPFGAAPAVETPSVGSKLNNDISGVKLLDTFVIPAGNTSGSSFLNCFVYVPGELDPQTAWTLWHTTGLAAGEFAAVNNSCPWPGPGPQPEDTDIVPVDFSAFATAATDYLYSIPAGDGIVTVSVDGIAATSSSGDHVSTEVNISGAGTVSISVYSTVREKITKLNQLMNYDGDGEQRPTEDDRCDLTITHDNQGKFLVNVHLDKNKAHVQTDNHGKSFQPYKVTLDHGGATDVIPSQPPPVIPRR